MSTVERQIRRRRTSILNKVPTGRFRDPTLGHSFNLNGEQCRLGPLGPSVSLDRGAPLFAVGELLITIPEELEVEGYVENEPTDVGTDLPVSTGSGPQHFSFIREVRIQPDMSFALEVYPVLSFTSTGGALPTYNRMSDAAVKAALLPLPSLTPQLMLLENRLISETGQPIKIHSFISFLGDLLCLRRDHLNEWTLPLSCHYRRFSALIVTENTCPRPQAPRIMMINPIS